MSSEWVLGIGILLSVAAYFAKNFVIEPMLEFRAVKGRAQNQLKYYSNVLTISELPDSTVQEVGVAMRQLGCDVEERYYAIAFGAWLSRLGFLPSAEEISTAGSKLIYLSNAVNRTGRELDNDAAIETVRGTLGLLPKPATRAGGADAEATPEG